MALSRLPKSTKHLRRDAAASESDSMRTVVVLVVALLLVVVVIAMLVQFSDQPEIETLDYAAGKNDEKVLSQAYAFRPINEGMSIYRPFFVSAGEKMGSMNIDSRNGGIKIMDTSDASAGPQPTSRHFEEVITSPWPEDGDGVAGEDDKERVLNKLNKVGGEFSVEQFSKLATVKAYKDPVVKVLPVSADQYHQPGVKNGIEINLKRETVNGRLIPLPGADETKGPFMRPIQMESPWLAFDDLVAKVGTLAPQQLADGDNGESYFEGEHPELILNLRGRVFTVQGRLFMLRKQPLRTGAYDFQGKKHDFAYFGIVSYLKQSPIDQTWQHLNLAFTTLALPAELEKYALEADQSPDNKDLLAQEHIDVKLSGVYFRRFCYSEEVARLVVDKKGVSPQEDFEKRIEAATYVCEDYMPWFVSQGISQTEIAPLTLERIKAIVDEVASDEKVDNEQLRRFDEAGYYLCLDALNDPSNALKDSQAVELLFRSLTLPEEERIYRGARAKVAGILRDTYYPLVLPPNISGKRSIYRTFVTDALDPKEADTLAQWYVDTIEPPVRFRGQPRVMVDGMYYRSQLFFTAMGGNTVEARVPLLLTRNIQAYDPREFPSLHDRKEESNPKYALWIALGMVIVVPLLILFLIKRDRAKRADFETDAMDHIRGRLERARERVRGEKRERGKDDQADEKDGDA